MRLLKNRIRLNQHGFDHIFMAVAFVVIIGVIGAGYLVIHGHHTSGTSHAAAGWGNQYCITDSPYMCLNAWGGGPRINVWNYGGTGNNDFYVGTLSNGNNYIMVTGNNKSYGYCIGDYGNSSSNASAAIDDCPTNSSSGGWGTNFRMGTCSTGNGKVGYTFYNIHWNGYLKPGGAAAGKYFYLNGPGGSQIYCFTKFPAA